MRSAGADVCPFGPVLRAIFPAKVLALRSPGPELASMHFADAAGDLFGGFRREVPAEPLLLFGAGDPKPEEEPLPVFVELRVDQPCHSIIGESGIGR